MFATADERETPAEAPPRPVRTVRGNHWANRNPDEFINYPRLQPLGYLTETRLIQRAQAGDIEARNQVWVHFARLTLAVVNEFHFPDDVLADAVQEGCIGIKRAIEKFDIERLNSFSTYAWPWIQQCIQRFLASKGFTHHLPAHLFQDYLKYRRELRDCHEPEAAAELDRRWRLRDERRYLQLRRLHALILAGPIQDVAPSQHPSIRDEQPEDSRPLPEVCRELLAQLNPRDRKVIELRFGLRDGHEHTLKEIGDHLGRTRERVRQLEARALKKLRKLARNLRDDYATELPDDESDAP